MEQNKNQKMPPSSTCSICLDPITRVQTRRRGCVFTGPCGHPHHTRCISRWLHEHNSCPMCRVPLTNRRRLEEHYWLQQTDSPFLDLVFSGNTTSHHAAIDEFDRRIANAEMEIASAPATRRVCALQAARRNFEQRRTDGIMRLATRTFLTRDDALILIAMCRVTEDAFHAMCRLTRRI